MVELGNDHLWGIILSIQQVLNVTYFILQQLVERTRQRRAMLNQKLGKTPDPAPRKRVLGDAANTSVKSVAVDDGIYLNPCVTFQFVYTLSNVLIISCFVYYL